MKDYLAGHTQWRTPHEDTPPLGVKMLLLNGGGVCVIGTWGDWAVAWAPLPKVPEHIKELLLPKRSAAEMPPIDDWRLTAGDMA
jgi:hypothetical protein